MPLIPLDDVPARGCSFTLSFCLNGHDPTDTEYDSLKPSLLMSSCMPAV
jgi:hypothetical protein